MSNVFISCSRWHIDFVRHLFDQLKDRNRDPWADWQDISATAEPLTPSYLLLTLILSPRKSVL